MAADDQLWDPGAYEQVNSLQAYVARQALSGLTVTGGERVLDVGCGDGRVTQLVVDRLGDGTLLGVDPSPAMVAAARQRFAGDERVGFEVGTAAELPYADAFDLVTSFNALHWELRWRQALERIRSALRPAGRAFLVFVCAGERPSLEDVLTETTRQLRWQSHFMEFEPPYVHVDPDDYVVAARAAGLAVERIETVDLTWDFETADAFAAWVSAGTSAWTARIPAVERADFVADALAAYLPHGGSVATFRFRQCRVALGVS